MFLFVFSQVTSKPRVDIIEIQTIIKEVCGHTIKHGLEDSVLMESSRKLENGSFKFSYHLVYPDIVFPCNNGHMKALATRVKAEIMEKLKVDAIDNCVYTRDRAFRAPLCFKLHDRSRTTLSFVNTENKQIHELFLKAMITNIPNEHEFVSYAPDGYVPKKEKRCAQHISQKRHSNHVQNMYSEKTINMIERFVQNTFKAHGGKGRVTQCRTGSDCSLLFRYQHGVIGNKEPCLSHGPGSNVLHKNDNQLICVTRESFLFMICPHGSQCMHKFHNFGQLMLQGKPILTLPTV